MSGAAVTLTAEAARSLSAWSRGTSVDGVAASRLLNRSDVLRHLLCAGRAGRDELDWARLGEELFQGVLATPSAPGLSVRDLLAAVAAAKAAAAASSSRRGASGEAAEGLAAAVRARLGASASHADARRPGASAELVRFALALASRGEACAGAVAGLSAAASLQVPAITPSLTAPPAPAAAARPFSSPASVALRAWRLAASRAADKPEYCIMHNSTLESIAALRPTTLRQLLAVPRVSQRFVVEHGAAILAAVAASDAQPAAAKATPPAPAAPLSPLSAALRSWRLETARAAGIPAFEILHNVSLEDVAEQRPTTRGQLLSVHRVTQRIVDAYGDAILAVVASSSAASASAAAAAVDKKVSRGGDKRGADGAPSPPQRPPPRKKARREEESPTPSPPPAPAAASMRGAVLAAAAAAAPPPPAAAPSVSAAIAAAAPPPPPPACAAAAAVAGALRSWRAVVAQSEGVPAASCLSDASLNALSTSRPTDKRSLRSAVGVGDDLPDARGAEILELIADVLDDLPIGAFH